MHSRTLNRCLHILVLPDKDALVQYQLDYMNIRGLYAIIRSSDPSPESQS